MIVANDQRQKFTNNRWVVGLLGTLAMGGVIVVAISLVTSSNDVALRPEIQPPQLPTAEEIANPHLHETEAACLDAIKRHIEPISVFIADAKESTPAFAESSLSFNSKIRLIADYIPFTKGNRHEQYIRVAFEQQVFSRDDLEQVVRQVVQGYLSEIHSLEGQMLVSIRTDVAGFGDAFPAASKDAESLERAYEHAIAEAMQKAGSDLGANVGTQLVSIIAGEVLTQVAVRMGVSAGILSAGASTSWATFGVGLVIGVIVDQIVAWIWDWWADPTGDFVTDLNRELDAIESDLTTTMYERLVQFAEERAKFRRATVLELLTAQ